MGRAEIRRAMKNEKKVKTATYNITKAQLDAMVREGIGNELERVRQEAIDNAVNTAMVLLLTLPLEVLMDHYWKKSYAKRIPGIPTIKVNIKAVASYSMGTDNPPTTINATEYNLFFISSRFHI